MASQDGRREGEEQSKAEAGPGDVKPGQVDLIAAMLASMRQEMAVDREAQAQRARRAEEQASHLVEVMQSSLSSLRVETQQYTDQACDSVRSELLEKVQTLENEVHGLREVERQLREVAASHVEQREATRVLAPGAEAAELLGPAWIPWQGPLAPRSVVSEPAATAGGWGAIGTAPWGSVGAGAGPIHPASLPPSPPLSPCRSTHRRPPRPTPGTSRRRA